MLPGVAPSLRGRLHQEQFLPVLSSAQQLAHAGVEGVAQAVSDQVEAQHGQQDRDAGKDAQLGSLKQVGAAVGEHQAPAEAGGWGPSPKKLSASASTPWRSPPPPQDRHNRDGEQQRRRGHDDVHQAHSTSSCQRPWNPASVPLETPATVARLTGMRATRMETALQDAPGRVSGPCRFFAQPPPAAGAWSPRRLQALCSAWAGADVSLREATSRRTTGATSVPSSSMARITCAWGMVPTLSCNRKRLCPKRPC